MAVCPNGHDSASDDFCDTAACASAAAPAGKSSAAAAPLAHRPHRALRRQPGPTRRVRSHGLRSRGRTLPALRHPRNGQFCEAAATASPAPLHPTTAAAPPPPARAPTVPASPSRTGSYSSSQPGPVPVPAVTVRPRRHLRAIGPMAGARPASLPAPPQPSMSSFPYPQATWTRWWVRTAPTTSGCRRSPDRRVPPSVSLPTTPNAVSSSWAARCGSGAERIARPGPGDRPDRPPADPGISRLHAVLISTPDGNWAVLDPVRPTARCSTFGDRRRRPGAPARRRSHQPGRLDGDHRARVRKFSTASTASAYNDGRLQALTYAHDHQPVLARPCRGRPWSRCRRQRQGPPASP